MSVTTYKPITELLKQLCMEHSAMQHSKSEEDGEGGQVLHQSFFYTEDEFCAERKKGENKVTDTVLVCKDAFTLNEQQDAGLIKFLVRINFMLLNRRDAIDCDLPSILESREAAYDKAEQVLTDFWERFTYMQATQPCNYFNEVVAKTAVKIEEAVDDEYFGWDVSMTFIKKPGNGYGKKKKDVWVTPEQDNNPINEDD